MFGRTFQLFCTAHIKVRTTDDGQKLIIRELDDNHSHEKSEVSISQFAQNVCNIDVRITGAASTQPRQWQNYYAVLTTIDALL